MGKKIIELPCDRDDIVYRAVKIKQRKVWQVLERRVCAITYYGEDAVHPFGIHTSGVEDRLDVTVFLTEQEAIDHIRKIGGKYEGTMRGRMLTKGGDKQ